jgi:WD40 repeat protein
LVLVSSLCTAAWAQSTTRPARKPSPASRPAEENLDLPIAGWIVEPDSRDKLPVYKSPMRLTLPVKDGLRVIANNQAGITHVGIGDASREEETWYIVNLTTGAAGTPFKVAGKFDERDRAIAADGSCLAIKTDGWRGNTIKVISTANGQAQDIPAQDPDAEIDLIGFASPERLVFTSKLKDVRTLVLFNTKTMTPEKTVQGGPTETQHHAFSPTGRYLAIGSQGGIAVYDMNTGESAGGMSFSKDNNSYFGGGWGSRDANVLSWSTDGKELAMRVTGGNMGRNRVMSVSTASGRLRLEQSLTPIEALDNSYQRDDAQYFQCLPDNSGYLSGFTIYDVATGNPVYDTRAMGVESDLPLLKIIDTNTLLACSQKNQNGVIVITAKLPRAEIDKALESVRGGGKSIDVTLPPLTPANADMAQPVGVLAPEGWNFQPDLVKDFKPLTFNSQPLRGTMAKNATVDYRLRQCIFTGSPANQALISYDVMPKQTNRTRYGMPPTSTKTIVDRISLDNKGILAAFELPPACRVNDATPDGKLLLSRLHDRVDIWKAPPGGGGKPTHFVGWRPWQSKGTSDRATSGGTAVILSPTRVLTLDPQKVITVWSIPECTALWTVSVEGVGFDGHFAVSPGRKHLAVATKAGVVLFDAATGTCLARLEGSEGLTGRLAFHPDGSKLAMVGQSHAMEIGDEVCSWDLKTGQITHRFYFPKIMAKNGEYTTARSPLSGGRPSWAGSDQLLIGRSQLLDLSRMMVTWRFMGSGMGTNHNFGANEVSIEQPPDERLWAITSQQNGQLVALTIPSKEMKQTLLGVPMQAELAVEPGSKVSVECQLSDPVLQKEWLERMKVAVKAAGWEIADNQPVKLVAAMHRSSRQEIYGQGFWGRINQQSVNVPTIKLEIALSFEGQTLWAYSETRTGTVVTYLREGQSLQGESDKANVNMDKTFLSNFPPLPPRITKPRGKHGFGASAVTPAGLQPYTGQMPD